MYRSMRLLQSLCGLILVLMINVTECTPRVLIGSPVRRNPAVLKEFLESLGKLKQDVCSIDYYFVDDNDTLESSRLLQEFAECNNQCVISYSIGQKPAFVCDDTTHRWSDALIERVAGFKNTIIAYALDHNYDYLFLIDSDLLLYPATIEHLIATGKDIISEVFWTRWQPHADLLPQVWEYDTYGFSADFVERLKSPGVYEVGGLGACTLISRKALQSGVNFNQLYNVTFWGEDRHFCIRAVALGFRLYVDTQFPAYHIYRDAELAGVPEFKKKVGWYNQQ